MKFIGVDSKQAPGRKAWRYGCVALAACLSGWGGGSWADTQTRTSAFDYDPATGLLIKQVVEPGDSNLCLVTVNGYDSFGNINATTTRNCNGATATFPGSSAALNGEAAAPDTGTTLGQQAVFTSRASTVQFTADGRFVQTTTIASDQPAPLKQTDSRVYDPVLGTLIKQTGPNGLSTQWAYDTFGRKILEQRADGNGTAWRYEYCQTASYPSGTATACPTVNGLPAIYVTTTTPVKNANVATPSTAVASGAYSKVYSDALNRPIRTETQGFDGSGTSTLIYQDTYYNEKGQVAQTSRPYFAGATTIAWTQYFYDTLGRLYKTQLPDSSTITVSRSGLVTTLTNDKLQPTIETRNSSGLVESVEDAKHKKLIKTWDAFGNLKTTTDSDGNVVTLGYDGKGRKTSMQDPDMGSWTYAYNALGELVQQTDAKSQVATMTYDVLGRMTKKTEPSLTSNWYYDKTRLGASCGTGVGKLCEMIGNNGYDRTYDYDSVGRVDAVMSKIGTKTYVVSYDYTDDGRPLALYYPSGLVLQNTYTSLGYLQKVVDGNTPATVYWKAEAMDAEGHVTQQTTPLNAITTINGFDPQTGRLTSTKTGASGSGTYAVQNVVYHYDTLGNLDSTTDTAAQASAVYGYDELNRLHTESRLGLGVSTQQTITWEYDDIGNINSRSDVGSYGYTGTQPHALTVVAGTVNGSLNVSYQYDANGNMTIAHGAGLSRTVAWTSFNKVQSITQTKGSTTNVMAYLYDPSGDRAQETFTQNGTLKRTTNYLNPGAGAGLLYEEEITPGAGTKQKHYLNAAGYTFAVMTYDTSTSQWNTKYWHKDNLGSTVVVTDAVGAVTERLAYEPFGKRRNADETTDLPGTLTAQTTRRGFTGHEMIDEVGLVNMNGRIFDPATSRFLSADPNVQAPDFMQSYNRYSYGFNNPLNSTDPTGYCFAGCFWQPRKVDDFVAHTVTHAWKSAYGSTVGRTIIVIVATVVTEGAASYYFAASDFTAAVAGGFVGGLAGSNGHLKAGVNGALTAAAFYEVGTVTEMHGADAIKNASAGQIAANVAGHALVGCASAVANGGKCGQGAASAGVSAAATDLGLIDLKPGSVDRAIGAAESAVIGGTTSVLSGGKFSNGAVTGAFGYLFNATAQFGIHGSFGVPGVKSLTLQWGFGVAVDDLGNFGGYGFWGAGRSQGAATEAGLSLQVSDAYSIHDLSGAFTNSSLHLGDGVGGSIDLFTGPSAHGQVNGKGFTLGTSEGLSKSVTTTDTVICTFNDGCHH
jgi:RHS repeat-associated protein